MNAVATDEIRGRTAWSFKVDQTPPTVYSLQPRLSQPTGFRNFPVSAFFRDASGVRMSDPMSSPVMIVTGRAVSASFFCPWESSPERSGPILPGVGIGGGIPKKPGR